MTSQPARDASTTAQLLVVGAGPGGYAAAFAAADLGLAVTLVDPASKPGGVCLYRGCIPSKALLHVAKLVIESREAAALGVTFASPQLDLDRIRAWRDEVVGKLTDGLAMTVQQKKVNYLRGTARLTDPHTMAVTTFDGEDRTIAFEQAILATGSRPVELPGAPADDPRIGAVDAQGNFVDPHHIFALALRYLVEKRGWKGTVVKTVSTTMMVDRLAARYGLPLIETPVGFNYIADHMLQEDVLIGGEESGGMGIRGHIPEGDGVLMGLLLLEILSEAKAPLHELIADIQRQAGPACYARIDLRLRHPVVKRELVTRLTDGAPPSIGGVDVSQVDPLDGITYRLADESWLLIRPSGTEPVLRVYAEAPDNKGVQALLGYGEEVAASV